MLQGSEITLLEAHPPWWLFLGLTASHSIVAHIQFTMINVADLPSEFIVIVFKNGSIFSRS